MLDLKGRYPKSCPCNHTVYKARMFSHFSYCINQTSAHDPQHCLSGRNMNARKFSQYPPEKRRTHLFKKRVFSLLPDTVHNVISLLQFLVKAGNFLRGVLKVAVHKNDRLAFAVIQTGCYGNMVSEISRKADTLYSPVFPM